MKGLPREARDGELVALDLEMYGMSSPDKNDGTYTGMSFAFDNGDTYLITDQHDIRPALERVSKGTWVMQNALFDLKVLRRYATVNQRYIHDTMLVEQDLFGGWFSRFDLQNLSRRWLSQRMDKEVRSQFSKATSMTPEMEHYAIQDAITTVRIAQKQIEYIKTELNGDFGWYYDIDEPALWAILDMKPPRVDVDAWLKHTQTVKDEAAGLEAELGFNVYSHKTVKEKIEAALNGKIRSTNANSVLLPLLTRLNPDHEAAKLIRAILEVRQARKAVETYGEKWIEQHVDSKGYVHPSYKVTGAETGRMACARPNMHNIPARRMPIFRTFFPASVGNVLQVADVSQQEPGFSALMSQDPVLIDEMERGIKGYHVMEELFNVDYDTAKIIYLGLNYGMSAFGLAPAANISLEAAESGMRARTRRYRRMTVWQGDMETYARRHFQVLTVTGRPVWVNPYNEQWRRNAVNGPIQGSAADHTKLAFITNHRFCLADDMPFCVTGVIHDEILQDVPKEEAEFYRGLMQDAWDYASDKLAPGIPMRIEVKQGENWGVK